MSGHSTLGVKSDRLDAVMDDGRFAPVAPSEFDEATPEQLSLELVWQRNDSAGLKGVLIATNVGDRTVTLSGKPGIRPIGADGRAMKSNHAVTMEGRIPGWIEIDVGERGLAGVSWSSWDGTPTEGDFEVAWPGGSVVIRASEPSHPGLLWHVANTSSYWWEREADVIARDQANVSRRPPLYYLDENGVRRRRQPSQGDL